MRGPSELRGWLIPVCRQVTRWAVPPGPPEASRAGTEAWLRAELKRRDFDIGPPQDALAGIGESAEGIGYADYDLLNTSVHQASLIAGVLRALGPPRRPEVEPVVVLAVLAHAADEAELAERALRIAEAEGEPEVKALNAVAAALGDRLRARSIGVDHPLMSHPFHQLLRYEDTLLCGRAARLIALREDSNYILGEHGRRSGALYKAISAAVALAACDGTVDDDERRLVDALIEAARLSDDEGEMLWQDTGLRPADVARGVEDPTQQAFILRLLYLTAHVNGQYALPEEIFLESLAEAFGLSREALDGFEMEALAAYEQHRGLRAALTTSGVVARMRRQLNERIEDVVRTNAARIAAEIKETSELGELLLKASSADLDTEEKAKVKAQLTDICKTIPALAIFVVPGGSLLLPIAVKHLPFNILPSNFADEELTLD